MGESRFSWEILLTGLLLTFAAFAIIDRSGGSNSSETRTSTTVERTAPEMPALPSIPDAPGIPSAPEAAAAAVHAAEVATKHAAISGLHIASAVQYDKGIVIKDDRFSSASLNDVQLKTSGGNIHITGGSGNEVRVKIIATGRDATRENVDDRYEVSLRREGSTLLAEVTPKSRGFFGGLWSSNISMNIIVETPVDMTFNARTSGGNIEASSLSGKQYLKTSGGNIRLDALTGSGEISTSGGNITANDLDGVFTVSTSGGNLNFDRCSGSLDAKTSGGNITLDFMGGNLNARTSGGNIRASLHSIDDAVDLSTSGGSITLAIPATSACDLSAKASSVQLDRTLRTDGMVKKNEVDVRINGGGPLVKARTSAGSISINKLK